jgi:hypothetical protein
LHIIRVLILTNYFQVPEIFMYGVVVFEVPATFRKAVLCFHTPATFNQTIVLVGGGGEP